LKKSDRYWRSFKLPVALTEKYTQTVGSVLGSSALRDTLNAGLIAIICMFHTSHHFVPGVGGDREFLHTRLFMDSRCGFCSFLKRHCRSLPWWLLCWELELPPMRASICFERVKELLAQGRSLNEAISTRLFRSFPTIRDANAVTAL